MNHRHCEYSNCKFLKAYKIITSALYVNIVMKKGPLLFKRLTDQVNCIQASYTLAGQSDTNRENKYNFI